MAQLIPLTIPYGGTTLTVEIPEENYQATALPAQPLCAVADEAAAVRQALQSPIGTTHLSQMVRPGHKIAILVSDYTRPTPSGVILEPVLSELVENGVETEDITIVVACGLHEPSSAANLKLMLGEAVLGKYKVINHNADSLEDLVFVGTTSMGIPVKINRLAAEADVRISVGSIDPHRFAGWSGGAKNVLPGIAARETVNSHHILLRDPATGMGITDGNPFREQLEEAARLAKLDFIINVILARGREIAHVVAGDAVKAHRAGVEYAQQRMEVEVSRQADILIASPGGAPRDREFWQTEGKGLGPVSTMVKDGGIVIIAAQCLGGIGNDEFAQYLSTMDVAEMEAALVNGPFSMALAKAYEFAKLAQRVQVWLVTEGLDAAAFTKIAVKVFPSLEEAVKLALEQKPAAAVLAVPNAAGVILKLR
ncbi:nickel-dependent lactate racemase [Anaerospora hongkongensis]|uniref:nickel-dependent lactate racemase n=1 Tax=Anaerospora hongkongensis TaxID=244830 RepID=UPI0028972ADB|nr:nickel-dependent lactate racemase [Anaerospora hongkongensis]